MAQVSRRLWFGRESRVFRGKQRYFDLIGLIVMDDYDASLSLYLGRNDKVIGGFDLLYLSFLV
ncbi:hypothetical protein THS27_02660 [Thalassospira sp. MCCC 1A01428]|nr:hypothetical protein THS27_02660 [Thalassospira sp. MCCC 1A01428]